jgi:hypothetical protein
MFKWILEVLILIKEETFLVGLLPQQVRPLLEMMVDLMGVRETIFITRTLHPVLVLTLLTLFNLTWLEDLQQMEDTAWLMDAQLPTRNVLRTTEKSKEKIEDLEVTTAMVGAMEEVMEAAMEVAMEVAMLAAIGVVMIMEMAGKATVEEEEASVVVVEVAAPAHLSTLTKSNLKLTWNGKKVKVSS